jgi:TonB family protein
LNNRRVFTFFFAVALGVGATHGQGASGQEPVNAAQQEAPASAPSTEQSPSAPKSQEYALDFIQNSKAVYPPAAKEKKIQGQVVGMILVSETGSVERVLSFKGDSLLAAAAEEAARKWKFEPVLKDGKPVSVSARATFNFVLADDIQDTRDVAAELDQIRRFPQRVRVSKEVSKGLLVYRVQPDYPPEARQAGIQGTVVLRAVISKDGSIAGLSLLSGHPLLARAAIDAVKQWKYKPYVLNGDPVEMDTEILVNFQLR